MKIALLGPDPSFKGGIGQYNHFLAQEILKEGHELLFVGFLRQYPKFLYPPGTGDSVLLSLSRERNEVRVSTRTPSSDLLPPQGEGTKDKTYTVERILSWDRPFSWMTAAKCIEEFSPDVVVVPWWTFFWYPWFAPLLDRLRRFKRVVIAHNASDHEGHGLRGKLSHAASCRILARADRVIVQSAEEKGKVERMGARAVTIIHHPVYPQFRTAVGRAEARKRFDIAEDGRVALLFGALRPYKGADIFAQALTALPDITGIIAGEIWDASLGAQLRDLAARHPNIRVIDRYFGDDEGALLFAACDAVVLPYRSVTGSGAAMAALGAGKPLIVSDLPLFRELFTPPLASFFTVGDPAGLARTLTEALTIRNKLQSGDALAMISERFGWDRLVRAVTGTMKTDVKN